jgi:hypothetical protein
MMSKAGLRLAAQRLHLRDRRVRVVDLDHHPDQRRRALGRLRALEVEQAADVTAPDLDAMAHARHLDVGPAQELAEELARLRGVRRQHVDPAEVPRLARARGHRDPFVSVPIANYARAFCRGAKAS